MGGDLQTLRDTLRRPPRLPPDVGLPLTTALPCGGALLAFHDPVEKPLALVLLLHGLGGSSDREGLRRMGIALQAAGFSVLRLNLRGAGKGRPLASGTYAALCNQSWWEQDAWEILRDRTWRVSWRTAGAIVADIRGEGDYLDWYCSGSFVWHDRDGYEPTPSELCYVPEGMITEEIRQDLAQIGWYPEVDQ